MGQDLIEANGLHKRFGAVHAVRGASFTIAKGQAVGLLGPNGAGKTTTIRMLVGSLPPDSGSVRIDGLDTLGRSLEARRRIGYLPESTPLYTEMTVTGLLRHRAMLFGVPRRERRAAIDRAIDRCALGEMRARRVGTLSKGYRQRVGLAAAILHNPPAILLDEPTNGLDPTQISEMRRLMRDLAAEHALVISSHILGEIEKTCDRVIVLAAGVVRADAPVGDLARATGAATRCSAEAALGDADRAAGFAAALRDMPAVTGVQTEDLGGGWWRISIAATPGARGLAEEVGAIALNRGVALRRLADETPTLERVFLGLVAQAEPAS